MPIYEQSVNIRKMSPVWWYATWRILARYVGIAARLTACRIAEISNLWYKFAPSSSSRMRVIYHNWSATKQRPHPQSVAEISNHSVLSGDRIRQCETSSGSRHKDTDQCL